MSFERSKEKIHRRALRASAESEAVSDSDDEGLDILEQSRKELNLSQYIDGQSTLSPCSNGKLTNVQS